jgi:hypothetical protein
MFVVLHMRDENRIGGPTGQEHPGHCFGPFFTEEAARTWDDGHACHCHRIILDLFYPE